MKIVEKAKATATLAAYADDVGSGPVVVTDHGKPVAVLMRIENADLETVALSTNRQFIELIERSRAPARGGRDFERRDAPPARVTPCPGPLEETCSPSWAVRSPPTRCPSALAHTPRASGGQTYL
jgi:PHD/YefM family antitoxin component YafN of YafNO toxin-antitoxin module